MPTEPHDPIYQPIVAQVFCDDPQDENTCYEKSACREFTWDGEKYVFFKEYELKKCNGTLAQTAKGFNRKKDYIRELLSWIKRNCGG